MKVVSTSNAPAAIGPYSQAIDLGNMVFVSGQIPVDPATGKMADTVEEQAAQSLANLKAILEGSVGGRAKNIAVYATSNRRHLIKETLTDRTGDDIHEADTRQELMSLSARFGLTVTFQRPEKARFETILAELAKQHGIDMPMDQLLVKAEAFAIRAGGRSPRVAKQFIEQCEAGVQK